ncbi:nicotinamide N-methyltransferase [Malassezia yamatoensis]|uniref:Nicotinamide N-methyltransferase n=1 Tax=Malassezia yamatoensis TaxID=253288 RepID=A0AAJ6CGH6_9BASI|nr:nicotinamide N-methyltransferase [Malassezia yamatoensis]
MEGVEEFHPSFGEPGASFVYRPKPVMSAYHHEDAPVLEIALPEKPMYMLFAHRVWRAGMLLADAIYANYFPLSGQNVLELGAGSGLPSLTAAVCTDAKKIVVTDYDDASILAALRANLEKVRKQNSLRAPIVVAPHTWGSSIDDVADLLSARTPVLFDTILLADCVWERFSHAALIKSITNLLSRSSHARVYMVAGFHTGRDTLVHFFRSMLDANFMLTTVPGEWPSCWYPCHQDTWLIGSEHILELKVGEPDRCSWYSS